MYEKRWKNFFAIGSYQLTKSLWSYNRQWFKHGCSISKSGGKTTDAEEEEEEDQDQCEEEDEEGDKDELDEEVEDFETKEI